MSWLTLPYPLFHLQEQICDAWCERFGEKYIDGYMFIYIDIYP